MQPEYPFKPPAIMMLTPNGRFKTNTRICMSMSDYHPETWNPLWSVASILTGLLSFMLEDTITAGYLETTVCVLLDASTLKNFISICCTVAVAMMSSACPLPAVRPASGYNVSNLQEFMPLVYFSLAG